MGHTSFHLNRRRFLQSSALAAGAMFLSPAHLKRAFAQGPITVGDGPYGPLGQFDENGIALPEGFTSREIARGASPVAGSDPSYVWHNATDGQATFPTLGADGSPDGGWILTANSEMPIPRAGGVSAVEFAPGGDIERAYRILGGTQQNCAGGPSPWGTWLSCEEHDNGRVWECDPTGAAPAVVRPALGTFAHEAVCVDPKGRRLYLTEDKSDGCWYRFTPADFPNLDAGVLELAVGNPDGGKLTWVPVPDPGGGSANPTRQQVAEAAHFSGGEGTWFDNGIVYFTTKGDNRVRAYDTGSEMLEVLYDKDALGDDAPLSGVDNITVARSGDIYVCEDGADHDICLITPEFELARFLKLDPEMHAGPPPPSPLAGNETVGVVFSPAGDRMYFGAQRSFPVGIDALPAGVVYEVSGPFRAGGGGTGGRVELRAKRRRKIGAFLKRGLAVHLALPQPVGIKASLEVDRGEKTVTVGRMRSDVAIEGDVVIEVKPTKAGERLLEKAERVRAQLKVTATARDGDRTVLRRNVQLRD
jgi:secreted PhoX family phosphatase